MRTATEAYVLRPNYAPLFVGVDGCVTLANQREPVDVVKALENRTSVGSDNYRNAVNGANGKGRVVDVRV